MCLMLRSDGPRMRLLSMNRGSVVGNLRSQQSCSGHGFSISASGSWRASTMTSLMHRSMRDALFEGVQGDLLPDACIDLLDACLKVLACEHASLLDALPE